MPLTDEEIKRIDEETEKALTRDREAKPIRKTRKKYIRDPNTTLQDLLYNEIGGKRIPRPTDIIQSPNNHINFYIKKYGIGDCYLLADLIHLSKTNPNFIMGKLINTNTNNPDLVKVNFFEPEPKITEINWDKCIKVTYSATSNIKTFEVTKDECLEWENAHKAFWPIAIEIAYSKFLREFKIEEIKINSEKVKKQFKNKIVLKLQKEQRTITDSEMEQLAQKYIEATVKQLKNKSSKDILAGGTMSQTYTILTGKPMKNKMYSRIEMLSDSSINHIELMQLFIKNDKKVSHIKPFKTPYSPEILKLYYKIEHNLKLGKMIGASFREFKKIPVKQILDQSFKILKDLQQQTDEFIEKFLKHCEEKISVESFKKLSENEKLKIINKFVLNCYPDKKISTSKIGMYGKHAYAIIGCREHDGHKYVIIANPYGTMTKIDYTHKIEKLYKEGALPKEVQTPQDIDNAHGECAMELNHFYKKLASISYEYDPAKEKGAEAKAYEALREMFK